VKTASGPVWKAPRSGRNDSRRAVGDSVYVPAAVAEDFAALSFLRPLRSGVPLGVRKGTNLVPDADAALMVGTDPLGLPSVEVDRKTALRFLHGDALVLPDAPKGFIKLCFEGHPLGFVKNLGQRCNNLHPARRRIRMDV